MRLHLLKWRFQPEFRSASRRLNVEEQRIQVASHLADNPSLKALATTVIAASYRLAVIGARREPVSMRRPSRLYAPGRSIR
jgi:hypothetical protein